MSLSGLLLRLALCVALVANGMATAMAGVRMSGHADVAHHHAHEVAGMADHCHQAATPATVKPAHPAAKTGDCCHVGACACHCLQQAQLAVAAAIVILPMPLHDVVVHAPSATRESPRLVHLIRPPIGQAS
jgi:hypothetical protein